MLIAIDNTAGIQVTDAENPMRPQHYFASENRSIIIYGDLFDTKTAQWLTGKDVADSLDIGHDLMQKWEGAASVIAISRNRVEVYTDIYRLFCLYSVVQNDVILISDSLAQLRNAVPLHANKQAALELACINCTIGNKSIYTEVNTLTEGCKFTFSLFESTVQQQKEYFWKYPVKTGNAISLDAFAAEFNAHVKTGIQLSDTISLALTAGLDSRATLAAALQGKEKLHVYTHGFQNSQDVLVAKRIAKHLDLHYAFYDLDDRNFIQQIPALTARVNQSYEGSLNALSHAHAVKSYENQQTRAKVFFSSFGGELLRTYYLPENLPEKISLDAMADGIRKISQVKIWYDVFSESETQINEQLNHAIYQELLLAPDKSDYVALADYYYHRRNFNSVTSRFAYTYFTLFNPYFSKAIYAMVPDLQHEWKMNGDIQKQIVRNASPYLQRVLLNNKDAVHSNLVSTAQIAVAKAEYYTKVLINKLTNKWSFQLYFTDYDKWLKENHAEWFVAGFDQNNLHTVFKVPQLQTFSLEYISGRQNFAYYRFLTNIFSYLNFVNG